MCKYLKIYIKKNNKGDKTTLLFSLHIRPNFPVNTQNKICISDFLFFILAY